MELKDAVKIKQFDVKAGDTVVITFPGRLSTLAYEHLLERGKDMFPADVRVWIIEDGGTVDSVLRLNGGCDCSAITG